MLHYLKEAAKIATIEEYYKRNFLLGCVGIRRDGAIVSAKNGAVISSTFDQYRIISDAHAECRVLRKLGKGGVLYVSRVLKKDGTYAMAKPCKVCSARIQHAKVQKVFFTIDQEHYGVWFPELDVYKIY